LWQRGPGWRLSVSEIGFLGVSFAFGLTVLTMAYAVGHISGGHFNCAVTIGLWAGGRSKTHDVLPHIIAQVVGAIAAAAALYLIASGKPDWIPGGFASNGYGDLSPGKYGLGSCFLIEVLATFFFLYVIIGTTSKGAAVGFAGIPIGLCLTLIHLFLIPVTNASVNPAPSTGPALFAGGAYLGQLWLFWLAPILGAAIAGLVSRWQHQNSRYSELRGTAAFVPFDQPPERIRGRGSVARSEVQVLISAGNLPPLAASFTMICLCNHTFIVAVSPVSPLYFSS
jgi:aquaporin Z